MQQFKLREQLLLNFFEYESEKSLTNWKQIEESLDNWN